MRDLHLTHLRAVLIIDDEDVQSILAMLHHLSGDNQGVPSPCPSAAPWSPRAPESFLAPDIVAAILAGKQPAGLTANKLMADTRLPLDWRDQRAALGFASAR
jgi:hypothetical protein